MITEDQALEVLEAAIEAAGGLRRFAGIVGYSAAFVSNIRNKRTPMPPSLAEHIGLRRVYAYLLTENAADPKQEQYRKSRVEYAAQVESLGYKMGTEGISRTNIQRPQHTSLIAVLGQQKIERLAREEAEAKALKRKSSDQSSEN